MSNKSMILDVILPLSFDVTPKGNIVKEYEDIEGYYSNEECTLQLDFAPEGIIHIEYYSDADRYILDELFPDLDTQCTIDNFVAKQYEISNLINLKTIDM